MSERDKEKKEEQPYIGAPVTLMSSLDVRYEGTLFTIDPNESTVALQSVRCLGTQGADKDAPNAIPPSDTIYEFIIFRGENIKSISIAPQKPKNKNELNDPSILKLGPRGQVPKRRQGNDQFYDRQYRRDPAQRRYNNNDRREPQRRGYHQGESGGRRGYRQQYHNDRGENRGHQRNYRRDNRRYNRRNQRDNRGGRRNQQEPRQQGARANPGDAKFLTGRGDAKTEDIAMSPEFDFEKATFDKNDVTEKKQAEDAPAKVEDNTAGEEEVQAKTNEEKKEESPEPSEKSAPQEPEKPAFSYKYNPDNFFDDLDLVDRANMDFKARRKIDAQTFGSEAENYKVRRRRRRGGNSRRRRNNRYNR